MFVFLSFENKQNDFELDLELNGDPMQLMEDKSDVLPGSGISALESFRQ